MSSNFQGDTLWLNPVMSTKHLKALDMHVVEESIRKEFILNNYGVLYEKHLTQLTDLFHKYGLPVARQYDERVKLRSICLNLLNSLYTTNSRANRTVQSTKLKEMLSKGKIVDNESDVEKYEDQDENQISNRLKTEIAFAFLPLCEKSDEEVEEKEVYVSAVATPGRFYVQLLYSNEILDRLNRSIADLIGKVDKNVTELETYKTQTEYIRANLTVEAFKWIKSKSIPIYCLAKLNSEEFFRAEIIGYEKIEDEVKWRVFFVDFGDENLVSLDDVYPMTETQMPCRSLPFQAIECSLELTIRPTKQQVADQVDQVERKWSKESGDYFWSLTQDKQNFYIKLYATAVSENQQKRVDTEPRPTSVRSYNIVLKKKAYPSSLNIAHQLVIYRPEHVDLTREERTRFFLCPSAGESLFPANNSPKSQQLEKYAKIFIIKMIK
jgi:hypothetical protein